MAFLGRFLALHEGILTYPYPNLNRGFLDPWMAVSPVTFTLVPRLGEGFWGWPGNR